MPCERNQRGTGCERDQLRQLLTEFSKQQLARKGRRTLAVTAMPRFFKQPLSPSQPFSTLLNSMLQASLDGPRHAHKRRCLRPQLQLGEVRIVVRAQSLCHLQVCHGPCSHSSSSHDSGTRGDFVSTHCVWQYTSVYR